MKEENFSPPPVFEKAIPCNREPVCYRWAMLTPWFYSNFDPVLMHQQPFYYFRSSHVPHEDYPIPAPGKCLRMYIQWGSEYQTHKIQEHTKFGHLVVWFWMAPSIINWTQWVIYRCFIAEIGQATKFVVTSFSMHFGTYLYKKCIFMLS